jgi:hypothetical protein
MKTLTLEQEAELYQNALEAVAAVFFTTRHAEYVALNAQVMAGYTHAPGEYRRRIVQLNRLCAEKAGVLPFAAWLSSRYPGNEKAA